VERKRSQVVVLVVGVLVLLLAAIIGAGGIPWRSPSPPPPPEADRPTPAAPAPEIPPPLVPPEEGIVPGGEDGAGPTGQAELPGDGPGSPAVEKASAYEREDPDAGEWGPGKPPPSRFAPGVRGAPLPGLRPGGGRSRFAPPRRDPGKSVLAGTVRDRAGEPVPGADVYRLKPGAEVPETGVVSFRYLVKIARTEKDGTFRGQAPGGSYLVTANLKNLLNRRFGLLTSPGVTTTVPEEGEKTGIEIRLPFAVADLGRIEGRLTDPEGAPVRGAEVFVDYFRVRTDKEGRFAFDSVLPGTARLATRRSGYEPLSREVEMKPGQTVELALSLEVVDGGSLILTGAVRDPEGEPVAGARIFITDRRGPLPSGRTGEDGRFELRGLPDRLAESGVSITVTAEGHVPTVRKDVPVPSSGVDFVLEKAVRVRLLLRNESTEEPVQRFRIEVRRTAEGPPFRMAAPYSKDGFYSMTLPPGTVHVTVEAPGLETKTLALDLVPSAEEKEVVVEMTPVPK